MKALLKVINLSNEDVIATSGIAYCASLSGELESEQKSYKYDMNNNIFKCKNSHNYNFDLQSFVGYNVFDINGNQTSGLENGTWYHFDGNAFHVCNKDEHHGAQD